MIVSEARQIKLSIVVAAWNGVSRLCECLSSLEHQTSNEDIEIIVVSNFEDGIEESKNRFPFAEYIVLSAESTVPQLRARGILGARGAIIALSEDFGVFDSEWCREIKKAHASGRAIIGGAIENTGGGALDWAVYFYDYGRYMSPNRLGSTDALSGFNVAYQREILEQIREIYADGFFETSVNEELKRCGYDLYMLPTAIVRHRKQYELKSVAGLFYHQARSFAGRRCRGFSPAQRLLFVAGSLFLPVLLPARVIVRIIGKRRRFGELAKSLSYLPILTAVWAFGEFQGYLSGEGKSSGQWR